MSLRQRYNALSDRGKLVASFAAQWIYWLLAWWLFKKVWPDDEPLTVSELLFTATWMALWMTVIFQWRRLKNMLRKKKNV